MASDDSERDEWVALCRQVEILLAKAWDTTKSALERPSLEVANSALGGDQVEAIPSSSSAGLPAHSTSGGKKAKAKLSEVITGVIPAKRSAEMVHAVAQSLRTTVLKPEAASLLGKRTFGQDVNATIQSLAQDSQGLMQHDNLLQDVLTADLEEGDWGNLDNVVDWRLITDTAANGSKMCGAAGDFEASTRFFYKQLLSQVMKRELRRWADSPLISNLPSDIPEQRAVHVYEKLAQAFPDIPAQCPTGTDNILATLRDRSAANADLKTFMSESAKLLHASCIPFGLTTHARFLICRTCLRARSNTQALVRYSPDSISRIS